MMADFLFLSAIFLFVFLLFYFLPIINGRGTLFGFIVSEDEAALGVVKKFRGGMLLIGLFFVSAIALGFYYLPKSLPFIYIFSVLTMAWWLHTNFLRSWRLRKIDTFSRFAATLKPRKLHDFTSLWWEIAVILFALVPIGILIHFYPPLPDSIPVHWNVSGEADRFATKSVFSVFFISFLGIYLQIFLVIIKNDIVHARFRIPAENSEQILPLKEMSHLTNINLLDWCRLMIGILFADLNMMLLSVLFTPTMATISNLMMWLGVVLLLCGVGIYGYQITLINRRIKEITGQIVFQTANEEKGWDSGIFYSNPDDVAFTVEKPGGGGYTFNLAHKKSYLYAGMIVLLMATSVLALILF